MKTRQNNLSLDALSALTSAADIFLALGNRESAVNLVLVLHEVKMCLPAEYKELSAGISLSRRERLIDGQPCFYWPRKKIG